MEFLPNLIIALSCAIICFSILYSMSGWTKSETSKSKKPKKPTIWFKNGKEL